MREQKASGEYSGGIEVPRRDPVAVSKGYYDSAILNLNRGAILDGLIDLDLAEDHLIGNFAPRHSTLDPEQYPLIKTLARLVKYQREARRDLLLHGPSKQLDPRYSGAEIDDKLETDERLQHRAD